jgi:formamidopyrimidine-DNA glycosylase
VPELPEVERARELIERSGLDREIVAVDDSDEFVCRPHAPGEIAAWLIGRRFTAALRRGKSMWLETDGGEGPKLGLHLGMSGAIRIDEPVAPNGWDRFSLEFADGGRLAMRDKRRLSRVRLDPDLSTVGPDAAAIGREPFRRAIGRGTAPLKARLMDQGVIAGVGNLLADEILWQARLSPLRPAGSLSEDELDALRRTVRAAIRRANARGGAHTGDVISHRRAGAACPRCGAPMVKGTVGGRTTWWCSEEQRWEPEGAEAVARAARRGRRVPA